MKLLSPRAHGYFDFLLVVGFAGGPAVLGFEGLPAKISFVLAVAHLLFTIVTAFPMGLLRIVPLPLHGLLEFAGATLLFAMPWIFGFSADEAARNFYLGMGASELLGFLITDYTAGRRR